MAKPLFNKVCIVGVGLSAVSLGIAIKQRKMAMLVMGVVAPAADRGAGFPEKALHGDNEPEGRRA